MKTMHVILSGLGGQGILFMTKILAQTALAKGMNVLGAETHGMAQRGGSVVSHLKIGEAESTLINTGTAHLMLALEENEAYRNLAFLAAGGTMVVNASPDGFPRDAVRNHLAAYDIAWRAIPATRVAMEKKAPRSANLALIGFMAGGDGSPFAAEDLRATIDRISPERFRAVNLAVFEAGCSWKTRVRP